MSTEEQMFQEVNTEIKILSKLIEKNKIKSTQWNPEITEQVLEQKNQLIQLLESSFNFKGNQDALLFKQAYMPILIEDIGKLVKKLKTLHEVNVLSEADFNIALLSLGKVHLLNPEQ